MPPSFVSYLSMMAIRIYYIHALLKDTGSFYLHCDSTMSHYLKILCDVIFGTQNFKREIIWSNDDSSGFKSQTKNWVRGHDILFFYVRCVDSFIFNKQYNPLDEKTVKRYDKVDEKGNRYKIYRNPDGSKRYSYLKRMRGVPLSSVFKDIQSFQKVNNTGEYLGYPTQKPVALLERIIKASSNEGDVVANFFCGCGTTVDAAVKLERCFIGADISSQSISLIQKRLFDRHKFREKQDYHITGFPQNIEQAQQLADSNKLEFQNWVIHYLINGFVNPKKTGDGGIDGWFHFRLPTENQSRQCLIEVKGGNNLAISQVRAFIKVCQQKENVNKAGLFITMGNITDGMRRECYELGELYQNIKRCEIVHVRDILEGKYPFVSRYNTTFQVAQQAEQNKLL